MAKAAQAETQAVQDVDGGVDANGNAGYDFKVDPGFDVNPVPPACSGITISERDPSLRPFAFPSREAYLVDRNGKVVYHDKGQTDKQAEMVLNFLKSKKNS